MIACASSSSRHQARKTPANVSKGSKNSFTERPARFTFSQPPVGVHAEPQLLEPLEIRLAPSGLSGVDWKPVTFETPILLSAGQGLATSLSGGGYLLHVESGQAMVFVTDLNSNGQFDPNELTGISAGNGLRLTSFVDINGDIVTNLNPNGTLTDLDPFKAGNDGQVLLNSRIDSIVLRTLTSSDVTDFQNRLVPSSYSIYGNIFAGGGVGTAKNDGLIIDTSGWTTLTEKFTGSTGSDRVAGELYPTVGYILTGTAASGATFSFGVTGSDADVRGKLAEFTPAAGQIGGDVIGVSVGNGALTKGFDPVTGESLFSSVPYQITGIQTGNGGTSARGGDIINVTLNQDVSGFFAIAGNGGNGGTGGRGGSLNNIADLGSYTTTMDLVAGNGGDGYSGLGGAGGTIGGLGGSVGLGQFSTTGNVRITLGDGGDGVAGGGNGSGLAKAAFTPLQVEQVPIPIQLLTTYREIGLDAADPQGPQASSIGTPLSIDFNKDGGADIVYLAQSPNQLVVRLGVGNDLTGYTINSNSPTYFLSAPKLSLDRSTALTVGDFNGDGFLDIAVASNQEYSRDGIHVFLWNDENGGFDLPLYSPVPFLNLGTSINYLRSGAAITNLVAGDFNADGITDLGFTGQYFTAKGSFTSLVTMSGAGDGYFYADFAYNPTTNKINALPVLEISKGHASFTLEASAIVGGIEGRNNDVILFAATSGDDGKSIGVAQTTTSTKYADGELTTIASVQGKFWERTYDEDTKTVEFSAIGSTFPILDFTVLDIDRDGIYDVVGLYTNGGIVAFKGTSDGVIGQPGASKGILLTGEFGVLGKDTSNLDADFQGILTGNFDGKEVTSNIAIYSKGSDDKSPSGFYPFVFDPLNPFVQSYGGITGKTIEGGVLKDGSVISASKVGEGFPLPAAYSTYASFPDSLTAKLGFGVGVPADKLGSEFSFGGGSNKAGGFFLYDVGFFLEAGDGGDSQLGVGGQGGSIGGGTVALNKNGVETAMPQAAITLLTPGLNAKFFAPFNFVAGDGGNGFSGGGAGGNVSGIASRFIPGTGVLASTIGLFAGDGGSATQGRGGAGGSIFNLSMERLFFARAGDGGFGLTGGNGGSIRGNGVAGLFDNRTTGIQLYGGDGGDGINAGGAGGSITSFVNGFGPVSEGVGGSLFYAAGDGGSAIAGKGGLGGSVLNSGPDQRFNYLIGEISVRAGDGGNGLTGGGGGSISNFINKPSESTLNPTETSFIAGDGGRGISGAGGNGGNISGMRVSATGPETGLTGFSRYIAGNGGESLGGVGGNGGSISSSAASSTSSSLALAAGAGGDGLSRGGAGGSVTSTEGAAAGGVSQILVVGGSGGDAFGYLATSFAANPNPIQQLTAFGGVAGIAGNGGNISNFSQPGGDKVAVNLVAGNGGSLMNYGSPGDLRPNVGRGGSISKINLSGDAGRIEANQAIVSYYQTSGDENMTEFVNEWLKLASPENLTTAVGNVGIIAGAAGRVSVNAFPASEGLPANGGVNGSVTNFSARNIMSMVAGSVERISAIQTLSNITVSAGGVVGAWKDTPITHPTNSPLYFDGNGNQTSVAAPGGALMDGAVLATQNNSSLSGIRVFTA